MLLQRKLFLTKFYTINSSPMLVTKSVFKITFVLSNYQTCTFPLKGMGYIFSRKPIYIKLAQFEDNDDRKFLLTYYFLGCCSFWETSKTSHENNFCLGETKTILAC